MNFKQRICYIFFIIFICNPIFSQNNKRKIDFPNIKGYYTLATDFHQHTVFSDGSVWPTIRVQESFKDGLDANLTVLIFLIQIEIDLIMLLKNMQMMKIKNLMKQINYWLLMVKKLLEKCLLGI